MARKQYMTSAAMPIIKNRTHHKAVRLLAKRAATLAAIMLCCIPKTVAKVETVEYEDGTTHVVNLDIKPNGNGSRVGPASSDYTKFRDERKKYLREQYRTRTRSKTPWYMLTSGKCWNYETQESLDSEDCYKRKLSEQGKFHNKYKIPKFSKEQYIMGVVQDTVKQWEKTNPMPQQTINGTKNAFYAQEYSKWIEDRSTVWNTTLSKIRTKENPQWKLELRKKLAAKEARWNGEKIAA